MKETVLKAIHEKLGAKMVPFAGFLLPLQYSGLTDEHLTVRKAAGVFDVSHMGEFMVEGAGSLEFLQKVTSNDVAKLVPGKVQYSCLPNDKGGIVDDLLVYMHSPEKFMLVVNASNIEKDLNWIKNFAPPSVAIRDVSDTISLLAVQGPKAVNLLSGLVKSDIASMPYYTFIESEIAGIKDAIISTTGYTGAGGFEIYVPNEKAEILWDAVMKAGAGYGIKPAGLAARDTLRLEMGFCLYGNDINDETSPIEAGLGWITKFSKEFINSPALKLQKEKGTRRKLVGFEMKERGIPRQGYSLKQENGMEIGKVTSGTMSPSLNKGIGMGYVDSTLSAPGTEFFVEIREKLIPAVVVALPFYKG